MRRIGWRAIARYLAGESSPGEAAAVEAWVQADTLHAELFESARRAWASTEADETAFDADRAWSTLSTRIAETETLVSSRRAPRTQRWRGRVAWASGLLAASIALALLLPALTSRQQDQRQFVTQRDMIITVHLADGSVVRMAPNSSLRVGANGAREAWLEGKAFFAIAKAHGQPFVVHTDRGDAQVLGTRFELSTTSNEVRLVVLEGRVALSAHQKREIVTAGQISFAGKDHPPTPARSADVQRYTDWLRGVLIFQATPLAEVARELQDAYHIAVHLDPGLSDRTLSGTFDRQSLQAVAAAICRVADATCEVSDTAVTMHD